MVDLTKKQIEKFNIKPCPFCNGRGELVQDMDESWSVACSNKGCSVLPITLPYRHPQQAVLAWNTRGQVDIKPKQTNNPNLFL